MNLWEGVCMYCNMYCLWCFMWVNVCGKGVCSIEPVTLHFHMSDMFLSVCT